MKGGSPPLPCTDLIIYIIYIRYGGVRETTGMDMKAISDSVIKENKENIKKKVQEEGYNAAAG